MQGLTKTWLDKTLHTWMLKGFRLNIFYQALPGF